MPKIKCKKCGDIIKSKSRHNLKFCSCGSVYVDGGSDYFRYGGNKDDFEIINEEDDVSKLLKELKAQLEAKDKEIERQDEMIREINKSKYDKLMEKDILFHLKNRNKELEAKLAESEERAERYKSWHNEKAGECSELKQQLANKEIDLSLARNEINTLRTNLEIAQEHDNIVCGQLIEKCKEIAFLEEQDMIFHNQLAVEQLKKAKKLLYDNAWWVGDTEYDYIDDYAVCWSNIEKVINNQIREIKGGE